MQRSILCCSSFFLTILALAPPSLSAAVVERDWKSHGDGLLTYDDINQREWLDLSLSLLDDQFPGSGANAYEIREARYQYVVSQTDPGGLFEGFQVARSDDVRSLAESAGIDLSTPLFAVNAAAVSQLQQLLGVILERGSYKFSIGLLDELGALTYPNRQGAIFILANRAELRISDPNPFLQDEGPHAVMLYRSVPEPKSIVLIVFCACAILAHRKG